MSKLMRRIAARLLLCALFVTHGAIAATGDWDLSFGTDGRLPLTIPGVDFSVRHWERQSDGKIVIVGHTLEPTFFGESNEYIIARFNANGTPDSSFDLDGYKRLSLGTPFIGLIDVKQIGRAHV